MSSNGGILNPSAYCNHMVNPSVSLYKVPNFADTSLSSKDAVSTPGFAAANSASSLGL